MEVSDKSKRKRFISTHKKLYKEYSEAGMTNEAIEVISQFDLDCFNRNRAAKRWGNSFSEVFEEDLECDMSFQSCQPIQNDVYYAGYSRFSWIEQVSDDVLYSRLQNLSNNDKELLTLLAFDGYSQTEISRIQGKTPSAISRKIMRLGKYLFSA
mgnify:CR=1 FL=1